MSEQMPASIHGCLHHQLAALPVDAVSAGEHVATLSRASVERIEALGDSNPPHMAEVIGRAIMNAVRSEPSNDK